MSRNKHTEAQMIAAIKQMEGGRKVEDVPVRFGTARTGSMLGSRSTVAWT